MFFNTYDKRAVALTGVFDILHIGHVELLNKARSVNPFKIENYIPKINDLHILIDTDERVRQNKGANRPINCLSDRIKMLQYFGIQNIHPFDSEETKEAILKYIEPAIFIKGGDYTLETVKERKLIESMGGEVIILPYKNGYSTTSIIERMKK